MSHTTERNKASDERLANRTDTLFQTYRKELFAQTDRRFAKLMTVQWVAAIALALFVSPRTWSGPMAETHLHVYAAVLLGGLITALPVAIAWKMPGSSASRHLIAAGQLAMSGLLIHLTGGRIETHFHIFASLGILSTYQDWRVLITGAAVTGVDHLVRGFLWPESLFGIVTTEEFRIFEHIFWVVLEVGFLYGACRQAMAEKRMRAVKEAEAEIQNEELDALSDKLEEEKVDLEEQVDVLLGQMDRFAEGDLTVRVESDREDAIGALFEGFNKAVGNVRKSLAEVVSGVKTARSSAAQVSAATDQLAAGAEEQSAQADEVAAAMEEMSRTILENADGVTRIANSAENNREAAGHGATIIDTLAERTEEVGRRTGTTAENIRELAEASENIGTIVETIEEIADQTNLLALNAAIEAARAGEHGKGFAVVADEVRQLAERTTKATTEIGTIVSGIQDQANEADREMAESKGVVEENVSIAQEARDVLQGILEDVQSSADVLGQLASAGEEQSATSEQISRSVESISTVSAESAEGINEIAGAAGQLNQITDDLGAMIAQFQIGQRKEEGRPVANENRQHATAASQEPAWAGY